MQRWSVGVWLRALDLLKKVVCAEEISSVTELRSLLRGPDAYCARSALECRALGNLVAEQLTIGAEVSDEEVLRFIVQRRDAWLADLRPRLDDIKSGLRIDAANAMRDLLELPYENREELRQAAMLLWLSDSNDWNAVAEILCSSTWEEGQNRMALLSQEARDQLLRSTRRELNHSLERKSFATVVGSKTVATHKAQGSKVWATRSKRRR